MRIRLLAALLAASLVVSTVQAQTVYTWTAAGATDQWSSGYPTGPFNWTGGSLGLPPTDAAIAFTSPTQYQTVDLQVSRTVDSAQFGGTAAYTLTDGSLLLSSGNLMVTGTAGSAVTHAINVPVALGASGSWSVDTSSLSVSGAITDGGSGFGITKTGSGTLTLTGASTYTGATVINAGTLQVGTGGSLSNTVVTVNAGGALTINGGSVTAGTATYFGVAGGASAATVNLSAGALSTAETDVGSTGIGVFTQTGGTHTASGQLLVGFSGGNGTYALSGTGQLSTYLAFIGYTGAGSFIQTGGAVSVSSGLVLGYAAGVTGSYALGGTGRLTVGGLEISANGTGTFTQTGGVQTVNSDMYVGFGSGGIGTYSMTAGTLTDSGPLYVGYGGGSTGTFVLQGGTVSSSVTDVGAMGAGTFIQTGGAHVIAGSGGMRIGVAAGSTGAYVLTGGTVQTANVSGVAGAGTSTFDFNGGTLQANSDSGAFVTLLTTAVVQAGGAVIDSNGHTIAIGQPLLHDAALGTSADGGLTKKGAGTLYLTGANTYTGGTVITGGILSVASDANLGDPSGSVTLANGGQLLFTANVTTGRTFNLNSSALAPAAGLSITYSGATVNGGFLRGPGTQVITGGATFSGVTAFADAVINLTGSGSFTNFTNCGTLTVAAGLTTPTVFNGFSNEGSGSITVGAGSKANAVAFQSYGLLTLNPGSSSSAATQITNTGTTPLYFNGGSRTFIGTAATATMNGQPTFLAGIDLHGHNAEVAGGLFVNNGFVADGSAAGTATVVADFGALVKGAGYFQNSVITQNGGKFQAGNSPGSTSFGNFVFGPGGVNSYVFAIDDATGTAGPHPNAAGQVSGWGLVSAVQQQMGSTTTSGNFTWTADPSDKLTLALDTLVNPTIVGTDVSGPMADFDPSQAYSWPAVRWTGTYSGPTDALVLDAATSFDTSGFENPINGTFGWSFDAADQTLSLTYSPTPVPEPGTLALTGMAAIGWVTFWRRRWQSNGPAATLSA
jgi:fibronectin-binding autotransporter adhesin